MKNLRTDPAKASQFLPRFAALPPAGSHPRYRRRRALRWPVSRRSRQSNGSTAVRTRRHRLQRLQFKLRLSGTRTKKNKKKHCSTHLLVNFQIVKLPVHEWVSHMDISSSSCKKLDFGLRRSCGAPSGMRARAARLLFVFLTFQSFSHG